MPLYKEIKYNLTTRIYLWKITETLEELSHNVFLNQNSKERIEKMQSDMQKKAYLSIRRLMQIAGYSDADLYYTTKGKPLLNDKKHISITHSKNFSAIIISNVDVGIDIEMQRDKIVKIAHKFAELEMEYLDKDNTEEYIRKLTVVWGIKESIFKIEQFRNVSFNENIITQPFELSESKAKAELVFGTTREPFYIIFEEIENFTLVYAFRALND